MDKRPHLMVSISAHGYGHVAQVAPVVNALRARMPQLRLTIRSQAPLTHLTSRIHGAFDHLPQAGDIGMLMSSALDVTWQQTQAAYRALHHHWQPHVREECAVQQRHAPDFVLADVGYLPLAAAQQAAIPCAAMCSLNWADIYAHYGGDAEICEQIQAIYANSLAFLRLTPGMPMSGLANRLLIGPVAAVGVSRRAALDARLGLHPDDKLVLVSLGGVQGRVSIERWPRLPGVRWLVQASWQATHPDAVTLESLQWPFGDLLASSDALICKPGYGSFVEAACAGVPVLFVDRPDWPESPALVTWLQQHGVCAEVSRDTLQCGALSDALSTLWARQRPPVIAPSGIQQAVDWLVARLS